MNTDSAHVCRGLRALLRLLASCQAADPQTRPPADVVAHHLHLIKTLLMDADAEAAHMDLLPIEGDALMLAQRVRGKRDNGQGPQCPVLVLSVAAMDCLGGDGCAMAGADHDRGWDFLPHVGLEHGCSPA